VGTNRDRHQGASCSGLATSRRTGTKPDRSPNSSTCTASGTNSFLTKTGDLGAVLKLEGIDYESLDHAGRDYAVKRLEAALRSLNNKTRLYQVLFKHNHPEIAHTMYDDPLVRTAVEQRAAFLKEKSDRLYSIEIYWVVMIDGSYRKAGLLHALAQLPKDPALIATRPSRPVLRRQDPDSALRADRARPRPATTESSRKRDGL
jgi:type IV secretory pathway VirB4 component